MFSPEAAPRAPLADMGEGGLPFANEPEPGVLAEILAAAPKSSAAKGAPDGGTLVGTNTGIKEEPKIVAEVPDGGARIKRASIEEGKPDVAVGIPSPAVERAARAQLYHPLVMRCRDADGKILPPDAVTLRFKIDTDGYIVPTSISAVAADSKHEAAAACMRRELSAAAFQAPASARGVAAMVNATVPSVD